ncbi:KTSC domain-containing protein [Luteimonas sp BLCC-B24]|uniref:KTSC domain-containing protein n=1 Tax=Luteimonas sp. BLCC-B24 TaxID=3025317 RepID=UPI00234C792E|nr:KTSC domain-containing protein [Luteimonas sp. BLCC-B24]MDC7805562.1 KTSC domain-containing protein [Luteimonas sp. BLCC-B24]
MTQRIELIDVDSSQIHSIGHDAETNTLAIRFTKGYRENRGPGALYHYANVDAAAFEALRDAESIGRHFGQHIKPFPQQYPYTRIDEPAAPLAQAA